MFTNWIKENRALVKFILSFLALVAAGWVIYGLFAHTAVKAIYDGKLPVFSNRIFFWTLPLEHYYKQADRVFILLNCWFLLFTACLIFSLGIKKNSFQITILFTTAASAVLFTFSKALIDVDGAWDGWAYHLPFAARMWGIVPKSSYIYQDFYELIFTGFPLLGEFLQGFFWFVFQRVQAANLVNFLGLILYLCFLKIYFRIPVYLSTIALLAIPSVQVQATSCYVDLVYNLCLSVLVMMAYLLYTRRNFITKRNLLIIILVAACAANIKFMATSVVFLALVAIAVKIAIARLSQTNGKKAQLKWLLKFCFIIYIIYPLVFFTNFKNSILHDTPFYPVKTEAFAKTLNYGHSHVTIKVEDWIKKRARVKKWVYSVFEIGTQPFKWSIGQGDPRSSRHRMGGYFGLYVIFNLLLLGFILYKIRSRETISAVFLTVVMSIVTSLLPLSHELRYYMYWMIVVVSLNLYLFTNMAQSLKAAKIINDRNIGFVYLLMFAVVTGATGTVYVRPTFYTLKTHLKTWVDPGILEKIEEGDRVCIVGKRPYTFLYAAEFHPPRKYSVKAAMSADKCNGRKVIK